jgi:hypothetical protein
MQKKKSTMLGSVKPHTVIMSVWRTRRQSLRVFPGKLALVARHLQYPTNQKIKISTTGKSACAQIHISIQQMEMGNRRGLTCASDTAEDNMAKTL